MFEPEPKISPDDSGEEFTTLQPSLVKPHPYIPAPGTAGGSDPSRLTTIRRWDFLRLVGIIIMLLWPWVFFIVVFKKGGQRGGTLPFDIVSSQIVQANFQVVYYFITLFATFIGFAVNYLLYVAILRFVQGQIAVNEPVTNFHLLLVTAFRTQWLEIRGSTKDWRYLLSGKRWILIVLVLFCVFLSANVTSSVITLLLPIPINQNVHLNGTELDFGSNDTTCKNWLAANAPPSSCKWMEFQGQNYSTCREDAMSDVLNSGIAQILAQDDVTSSVTFTHLGVENGLTFDGPSRGVLPVGPNGFNAKALAEVDSSFLTNLQNNPIPLPYNYNLQLQGIGINVTCQYDTQSPISFCPSDHGTVVQFNGTCPDNNDILSPGTTFTSLNSNNSLGFWACKSPSQDSSYTFYLSGNQNYARSIGNITCTVSGLQPARYQVSFDSGIFRVGSRYENANTSGTPFNLIVDQELTALGQLIADGQTQQNNLFASTVINFGVQYRNLSADQRQLEYLPVYESMIQGILEYEVSFSRLLYSTIPDRPSACTREVNGTVSYMVVGFSVDTSHFGFLMPMTLLNLASLILMVRAMYLAKKGSYKYDIIDHNVLAQARYSERAHDGSALARPLVFPANVKA